MNWYCISKHSDKVNWYYISKYQKLSFYFILINFDMINLNMLSDNENISEKIKRKFNNIQDYDKKDHFSFLLKVQDRIGYVL